MDELLGEVDLAAEPSDGRLLVGHRRVQQFDGDIALHRDLLGAHDRPHAPGIERFDDPVALVEYVPGLEVRRGEDPSVLAILSVVAAHVRRR